MLCHSIEVDMTLFGVACGDMSNEDFKGNKIQFEGSYDKQNHTFVVISYEMTTHLRFFIYKTLN